jgi:hypothetical protein
MATITTRAGKGAPLTNAEVDANFTNLNTDKFEAPSQTGNAGKFLTTNGVVTSWDNVPAPNNGTLTMSVSGTGLSGSATFTANQAGGSTFTVASNATSVNTNGAIVARDGSGNFSAGTITAALSGNATTATTLQTARTIGGVSFNGSANINLPGVNTAGNQNTTGTAANVTGTVAIANGGTGLTSLGAGVATFLGTPTSANLAAAVTDETGSGALVFATSPTLVTPALGTPSSATLTNATGLPTAGLVDNAVTNGKLRDSAALSVIGRSANSIGDPADIAAATDHQVLRRSGTALGFGAIALNQAAAITGALPVANGGTGSTTAVNAKIALAVITAATGSAVIPAGTTAQRNGSPAAGNFRFNSDTGQFEGYNGTAWGAIGGAGGGGGLETNFLLMGC